MSKITHEPAPNASHAMWSPRFSPGRCTLLALCVTLCVAVYLTFSLEINSPWNMWSVVAPLACEPPLLFFIDWGREAHDAAGQGAQRMEIYCDQKAHGSELVDEETRLLVTLAAIGLECVVLFSPIWLTTLALGAGLTQLARRRSA